MSKIRPIAHLDGQTVLISAWLYNYRPRPNGQHIALLLRSVKLLDYETGKQQLAPVLDHCWLWIPEHFWPTVWKTAISTGHPMTLHDDVWLCCTVGPYRRADGSSDWGLRPRNQFPVSPTQCRRMQRANTVLWRRITRLDPEAVAYNFVAQSLFQTELEHKAVDWRELGRSYKDACTNVRRNVNALQRRVDALTDNPDFAEALERFQSEGASELRELYDRLAAAER
jgi:hypothetical protein